MLAKVLFLALQFVFGILSLLLMVRFCMQLLRLPFFNRLGAFVLGMTDWLVCPLRRVIPPLGRADLVSLLLAWLCQAIPVWFGLVAGIAQVYALSGGEVLVLGSLLAGFELLRVVLWLMFAVVVAAAVLSWFAPHLPAAPLCNMLAAPLLRPFRRVPTVANINLAPFILLLLLQIALILLVDLKTKLIQWFFV